MDRNDIFSRLCSVLEDQFHTSAITEDDCDKALIGSFGFDDVGLLRLYILVQQVFGIRIEPKQLQGYQFNTLNGIIRIIQDATS